MIKENNVDFIVNIVPRKHIVQWNVYTVDTGQELKFKMSTMIDGTIGSCSQLIKPLYSVHLWGITKCPL